MLADILAPQHNNDPRFLPYERFDGSLLIDEWRRLGVEVVFLNRPLGESPEDDLLPQVQGIVEYERAGRAICLNGS